MHRPWAKARTPSPPETLAKGVTSDAKPSVRNNLRRDIAR
jgi:hypothetical protein